MAPESRRPGSARAPSARRALAAAYQRPHARALLRLIWQEHELSRAELARRTGLSRSTVSELVAALLATGLVTEGGAGPSRGGRRPIVLKFQDDAGVLLGIDIGATHVAVVLTNLRGIALGWEERLHPVREDPEGTRALVVDLAERCLAQAKVHRDRLVGIGVALPCPVDPREPDRLSELVLPAWKGHSGLEILEEHFGVPVMMDNDANLGALAERWWGAGRGIDDFAFVKVATGVGSGHFIGGRIYRGATGTAGEIGHVAIDPQGAPCICGLRGCLTTLVGSQALVARATALAREHRKSPLAKKPVVTIPDIVDAALAGDAVGLKVVTEAAEHLGIAIAGMLNLLNPSRVIIGGGMARLNEVLLEPLRKAVRARTLVTSVHAAEIVTSALGPKDVAIGAATLALQEALADPRYFEPVVAGA